MKNIIHYGNYTIKAYERTASSGPATSFAVTIRGRHVTRQTIFELIEYIDKLPPAKKSVDPVVPAYKIDNYGKLTDKGVIIAFREEDPKTVFFSYEDKHGKHVNQVDINQLAADVPANLEIQKEGDVFRDKANELYKKYEVQMAETRAKSKELAAKYERPNVQELAEA